MTGLKHVIRFKQLAGWYGGSILVAADNIESAKKLLNANHGYHFRTEDCIGSLDAYYDDINYTVEDLTEKFNITADIEDKVIYDDLYE